MLIDTHAHLNFKAFHSDWKRVADNCLNQGVWIINVGSQHATSQKAVEIAQNYENGVFAAIGLHPIHAEEGFDAEKYRELAQSEKVVAIGEIGLDCFKDYGKFMDKQREVLTAQINLAVSLHLPVIFHCRMAHNELIEIIKGNNCPPGVIHCFTGNWSQAEKYLDMGFFLGINGIMQKLDLKEVIEKMPLNRLLVETDSPYLVPSQAKVERNEPGFVKHIVQDIAEIKGISFEEVAETTTQNAQKLFGI